MSKETGENRPLSLLQALEVLEKEKNIKRGTLLEAIKESMKVACKNNFGKNDNVEVDVDETTGEFHCYQLKTVVEEVTDPVEQISLVRAQMIDSKYELGDVARVEIRSMDFGRIATQNAKNVILQKIREEERNAIYAEYHDKYKDIIVGTVQRCIGKNVTISLGKADALLSENEQIPGETYEPGDRITVYVTKVEATSKGPKILVSRTHRELVKRLFEKEVAEVDDGTVEIKAIAREAGSRTKIAVYSENPNVDPVGACVGQRGTRVDRIVSQLNGEKIDIIEWRENPAELIQNALSPAKCIYVSANEDKTAMVVVPDNQQSLAIGKEGQNARLAARLTGYKIDIKSETQALEPGVFPEFVRLLNGEDEDEEEYYEDEQDQEEFEPEDGADADNEEDAAEGEE